MQSEEALQLRQRVVAASGASIAAALVVNPLDVVKTRIQAQYSSEAFRGAAAPQQPALGKLALDGCATTCAKTEQAIAAQLCRGPECSAYGSTADGLRKIIRREGVLALWRGTDIALLMAIPMVGVYLPLYDFLNARAAGLGGYAPLIAGASARTAAVLATSPLELLRVRMQAYAGPVGAAALPHAQAGWWPRWPRDSSGGSNSTGVAAHRLAAQLRAGASFGRVQAMWTGVGATLARDVPFSAIYWGLLEPIRRRLLPAADGSQQPSRMQVLAANFAAGSLGGAAAAAITTPLDVAKTRAQLAEGGQKHQILATLQALARDGGSRALFAGVGARAARAAPACAIVLASYELLKASPLAS